MKTLLKAAVAAVCISAIGFIASPSIAQVFPFVAGDVTRILGNGPVFPFGLSTSEVDQQADGQIAFRHAMTAGVLTWTFTIPPTPPNGQTQTVKYAVPPSCTATEEGAAGRSLAITAISATAITVTSSVTSSNTDVANIHCFGDPN